MNMTLKPLALAATIGAAVLSGTGPAAHADLVGHWISGAANLNETSGYRPAGTHDGVAVGGNAGSLAFSSDVPAGFSGRSLDLIGNVGVSVANSSTTDGGTYQNTYDGGISSQCTIAFWAKGFPGTWAPWVAKRGEGGIGWQLRRMNNTNVAGFTLRGVANEDGLGSSINVNDSPPVWHHFAGVWDQATGTRHLYIDGVFSHTVTSTPADDMSLAAAHRLVLGARANPAGTDYEAYFTGKLFDVRIYNAPLTQSEIVALILQVPTGLVAAPGDGKVGLAWTPTPRATGYTVWTKNTVTNDEQTDTTTDAFFTKTGLDNGTPYLFKVKATNSSGTSAYSAEVGATPALSSAKDILSFSFTGYGNATISGTNITKYMPSSINLTNLAPTYTTSFFATGSPVSGTVRDFTFPQTYTITAEDGSTKDYTVTVALVSPITYDFTGGLQGWTQIQPTLPAVLWQGNALGSGYDGIPPDDTFTRFGRSPVFYLLDSGPLTFYLNGGQSPLAEPHVGPSAIPAEAIQNGGFAGVALRDVATDTYVLSRRKTPSGNGYQQFQFTAAELAPFVNNGKQYTLDYLDYNKGGWGWTYMDTVSIPGVAVEPGTEALITSIKIGAASVSEISGTDVTVWLPYGTNINALSPLIAVSPGATLSPPLGTVRDFTTPQTYTVISGNSAVSNEYTVTVVAAGSLNLKTYDTTSDALNLDPISNLMAVTPTATGTQVAELFYGDFAASLPGVTDNETFSVLWDGWFDVSKDGPGDYTFGTASDDGSVIYLDLNNDGDFADPGELVVNNNGLHGLDQIRTATVYLPMDSVRIAIGYFEQGGGEGLDARFQRGTGLAFGALQRIGGMSGHFRATQPPSNPASSVLWYLTHSGRVAQPYGSPTELLLLLPEGTPVTNVSPAFTLSPGSTCVPPLGTARDFTTPQTYTVTSQDGLYTTEYTVIVRVEAPISVKIYDTTDGTGYLAPLSNLQAVTPTVTATQLADINYVDGGFVGNLPGLTSADNFSVLWEGWFNVGADGPGDYTFGTRSDDGSVLYLDLSNDGDFDDPGELIVNSNYVQGPTTRTATVNLLMDKVRFAIGYFEVDGGEVMEARFGKGSGVAWEGLSRVAGNTGLFSVPTAEPASKPSSAALWYANYAGHVAVPTNPEGTNLVLAVPVGSDLAALPLAFNISPGATCVPASETALDFTVPQTYTVTSEDSSTVTDYTITISHQYLGYNFNNGTLQGWRNIVWDLAANGGAGGWIELAPNATTMPASVNGGAIQPPSADNGLFGINNGEVYPNGNFDNHLNTQWLRSPAFYLDAVADLTLQLRRGVANTTTDPVDEAAVPYAAITNSGGNPPGGWKGVVLRRASDGAFLLVKRFTGTNGDAWQTITFTAAELAPFDGVGCTIELINSDRGGWGWVSMDNVFIPATGLVPVSAYDSWRAQYPDLVGAAGEPGGDADSDGDTNLQEYGFATDPMNGASTGIAYSEGNVTAYGQPTLDTSSGYAAVFGRRVDRVAMGLTYTVQFSADLSYWEDGNAGLTPVATDSVIEVVKVPFPATINPGPPVAPTFFRVKIRQN